MVAQRIAVARALRDRIEQDRRRHPGTLTQHHHFSNRHRVLEHQRVIDQLDHLPAAHAAAARDIGAHVAQQRFDARIEGLIGADHDAELTALRRLPGPSDRCVGERNAFRRQALGHGARDRNGGRAQIHDDRRRRATRWRAPAGRGRPARPADRRAATRTRCRPAPPLPPSVSARRALVPSSAANAAGFMSKAMTSPLCLSATLRHIGPPMTPRPTKPITGTAFSDMVRLRYFNPSTCRR